MYFVGDKTTIENYVDKVVAEDEINQLIKAGVNPYNIFYAQGDLLPLPTAPVHGEFYTTECNLLNGNIFFGDLSSLTRTDTDRLSIQSALDGTYYKIALILTFQLGGSADNMILKYAGRFSTYRGQYIFAFNWTTARWEQIAYFNCGLSEVSKNEISVPGNRFVSNGGEVQIKLYSYSTNSFNSYLNMVKLVVP